MSNNKFTTMRTKKFIKMMGHYKVRRSNTCYNLHYTKECCKPSFGAQRTKMIAPCDQILIPKVRMEGLSSYRSQYDSKAPSRTRPFKPVHNFGLPLVNSPCCERSSSYKAQFVPKKPQPIKSAKPVCCYFPRECKTFCGTSTYKTDFDEKRGSRFYPYRPKDNIKIPFNRFHNRTTYKQDFPQKSVNQVHPYAPQKCFALVNIPMKHNMSLYQQDYQEKKLPVKLKRRKQRPFSLPFRFADLTTYRCSYQQFNFDEEPYIWRTSKKKPTCNALHAHFFCCGDPPQGSFNHSTMPPPCCIEMPSIVPEIFDMSLGQCE